MATTKVIYGHFNATINKVNGIAVSATIGESTETGDKFVTIAYNAGLEKEAKLTVFHKDSASRYYAACAAHIDYTTNADAVANNPEFAKRILTGDLKAIHAEYATREVFTYKITLSDEYVFLNIERTKDGTISDKYKRDVDVKLDESGNYSMDQVYTPVYSKTIEFASAEEKTDRDIMLFISSMYRIVKANSEDLKVKTLSQISK